MEQTLPEGINQQLLIQGGITSVVVVAALLALRFTLAHFVRGKTGILNQDQRRWINRINNGTSVAVVIALVLIWAPQLHTFALSLTAVAVALVLTTKELLMCLTGGFLRASSSSFDIGDWITVDGVTGEVTRTTPMTTVIEEVDTKGLSFQHTGETIHIPNSRFLTANVENANFVRHYIYHDFPITVNGTGLEPNGLMDEIKAVTETFYAPLRDDALAFNKRIEQRSGFDFADPEPQYFLRTTETGHLTISIRLFLPTREAASIATRITQDVLSYVHRERTKLESTAPA